MRAHSLSDMPARVYAEAQSTSLKHFQQFAARLTSIGSALCALCFSHIIRWSPWAIQSVFVFSLGISSPNLG
jgi:hypothetical protein